MNAGFIICISAAFVPKKIFERQIYRNYFVTDLLASMSSSLQAHLVPGLLKNNWCVGVEC